MSALAIAILLLSTATYSSERDAVFTTTAACSIEPDRLFPADAVDATGPARAVDPPPRSLFLSAESRVLREDASELSARVLVRADGRTPFSTRRRFRLESPGRAWPFALAATADAATTYWALAHGGRERNPLLAFGRMDVGMVEDHPVPAAREGDRRDRSAASPARPPASLGDARLSRGPRRQQREDGSIGGRAGPRRSSPREALARTAVGRGSAAARRGRASDNRQKPKSWVWATWMATASASPAMGGSPKLPATRQQSIVSWPGFASIAVNVVD
jgi:hypothetical protein